MENEFRGMNVGGWLVRKGEWKNSGVLRRLSERGKKVLRLIV